MRRFLDSEDHDDPMLSVVNVIDVFLVIVVLLLIMVARTSSEALEDAANRGGDIVPQAMETLERYETSGEMGEGTGVRAGTTYRLDDGTMVFVPDE